MELNPNALRESPIAMASCMPIDLIEVSRWQVESLHPAGFESVLGGLWQSCRL